MARAKHSAIPDEQPGPDEGFKMGATPAPDDDVEGHRFRGIAPAPAKDDAPQPEGAAGHGHLVVGPQGAIGSRH